MDKLDILNRGKFVEQLVRLIENVSDNKTSTCFAINGAWGSGKSFVLDMFEEELSKIHSEETLNEKYFIVRYNCWKYDYYEEPLIAIVSAIISGIDEKVKVFPDSQKKQEILGMFKATGTALLSIANEMVKSKIGVDFLGSYEKVKEGEKAGAEKYEKEHAYNTYLGLNKVIDKLSELLQEIAHEYTVVIIVDELDRCIPDYAIKVLERLHHLAEEKKNIITVVAVDKQQLESSVKQLFGFESPSKYLEKFFNFEIKLDKGEVSREFIYKYSDYVELFDKDLLQYEDSVEECLQEIFKGIGAREQEQLVKKAMITHKLLYQNKMDYAVMCVELIITVMYYVYNYNSFTGINRMNDPLSDAVFLPYVNSPKPKFVDFFKSKFKVIDRQIYNFTGKNPIVYAKHSSNSLYSTIYFLWYYIHNEDSDNVPDLIKYYELKPVVKNAEELKKFVDTIKLLK